MTDLQFNTTPLTKKLSFVQRLKLCYKLLTTKSFLVIFKTPHINIGINHIEPVGMNLSISEINEMTCAIYINTIDVVHRDESMNVRDNLALCN